MLNYIKEQICMAKHTNNKNQHVCLTTQKMSAWVHTNKKYNNGYVWINTCEKIYVCLTTLKSISHDKNTRIKY